MASTTAVQEQTAGISPRTIWTAVGLVLVGAALVGTYLLFGQQGTEAVLASTVRQSTPLILGALCGLIGERPQAAQIVKTPDGAVTPSLHDRPG